MPPRKHPFPPESDTEPELRARGPSRESGPAPKGKHGRAAASTAPTPKDRKVAKPSDTRSSGVQARKATKGQAPRETGGATVDEVVADLTRDPRHERDD
jgi:hypothetical protein